MRRVLLLLVGLGVLAGIGVFFVDRIVASVIETGIEEGLGVEGHVGSVKLGLLGGTFALSDLRIANPPGFQQPGFLRVGRASTAVSFANIRANEVVIPQLVLEDIEVTLEWNGRKRNVDVLAQNARSGGGGESSSDGRKFVIEEVVLRNVKAHLVLGDSWLKLPDQHLEISEIKLHNVGRASGGVHLREVTLVIVNEVVRKVALQGPQQLLQGLSGAFGATGSGAASPAEEILRGAGQLLEGLFGGQKRQ